MTLDEAIAHAREKEKEQRYYAHFEKSNLMFQSCLKCAEEHEQLAEWLEELKELRELKDTITSNAEVLEREGYNEAIDDFAKRLTTYLGVENATKYGNKNAEQMRNSYGTLMNYEIADAIEDVAEQLKVGEQNDSKKM